MDEREALRKAIRHYESVVKDYIAKGQGSSCYARPILSGLNRLMARLDKAEGQVERFDDFVKMIKG